MISPVGYKCTSLIQPSSHEFLRLNFMLASDRVEGQLQVDPLERPSGEGMCLGQQSS